jgi:hypothetical protein
MTENLIASAPDEYACPLLVKQLLTNSLNLYGDQEISYHKLSRTMSSSLCRRFVSFLQNAATHPLAIYPIAATNGVSVVLDSMGAPHEPPNSLNNRDAANVQLPEDDYNLSVS